LYGSQRLAGLPHGSPGGRVMGRSGVVGVSSAAVRPRDGGVEVSEVQRARMLSSAIQVVSEYGYGKMSVSRVTGRARVSRRTFYDLFEDREDCFLAVFDDALERVTGLVAAGYGGGGVWRERVRGALGALLVFLDEEPGVGRLLIVDALKAGPRVLERRAGVLQGLAVVLQREGALRVRAGKEVPALTGEWVVGAVFSVLHTRLLEKRSGSLTGLLSSLMGMIVLAYEGPVAARKELQRPVPEIVLRPEKHQGAQGRVEDLIASLPIRITYRTLRVLTAIGEQPDSSNRGVAECAGVTDQGQISKLLGRLERLGLIENTVAGRRTHQPTGEPNAWRLTSRGQEMQRAVQAQSAHAGLRVNGIEESS
jgi:AcrR family transcriptional regulator